MLNGGEKADGDLPNEGMIKEEEDDLDSDSEAEKGTSNPKGVVVMNGSSITEADILGLVRSEYLPIKGIVALSNFRYRVQLNTFKHERRKFSRNSNDLLEVSVLNSRFNIQLLYSEMVFVVFVDFRNLLVDFRRP